MLLSENEIIYICMKNQYETKKFKMKVLESMGMGISFTQQEYDYAVSNNVSIPKSF
ncbi:MAG: hypothetical protein ACJAX4_003191 [Clostridium sp.]|jgi:hypothetical protein